MGIVAFGILVGVGFVVTREPSNGDTAESLLTGPVRIVDGDTFDLAGTRVRLWGVDAPEREQNCLDVGAAPYACGERSTDALRALTAGRLVSCTPRDADGYGRMVARCSVDGQDIGQRLVRDGHALDYTRYSNGRYLADERRARLADAGVWQGTFTRPEDWRHGR